MQRPYSLFLEQMIFQAPKVPVDICGSTPAFPFSADYFCNIKIKAAAPRDLPEYEKLASLISNRLGCQNDNLIFTPGSSQALTQALAAITKMGETVLIETPYYEPFKTQSEFLGLKVKFFQRTGDIQKDHLALKSQGAADVLLLTNAHTPLGGIYPADFILKLCSEYKWVIVDEDFYPLFTDGSMTGLKGNIPENLITLHTFSKSLGVSFIRLGVIRANKKVIYDAHMAATNFHIDMPSPSIQIGAYAMERWDEIIQKILSNLKPMQMEMQKLTKQFPDSFTHDFSRGHFNFVKKPDRFKTAEDFSAEFLKETGFYMRPGRLFELPEHLRFHIFMTQEQMRQFSQHLRSFL